MSDTPTAAQPGQRMSLDQALREVQNRLRDRKPQEAEQILRQILKVNPAHPEALHQLGLLLFATGRRRESIAPLIQATKAAGTNAMYHANLCEIARQNGDLATALDAGQKAVALRPNYAEAWNNLGIAWFDQHDFRKAIECYRTAIKHRADYVQANSNLANALHQLGEDEEALACYDRALRIDPNFVEAQNNKATVLRDLHRHEEAVPIYRKALERNPNYVEAINNLGLCLNEMGQKAEAIELFKRSIALRPNFPDTHTFLGTVLVERKRGEEALVEAQTALRLAPRNPENHNLLGRVYFELGRYDEALAALDEAVKLNPRMADAWNNRGNMLKELGRMDEARAAYEQALTIKPSLWGTYVNYSDAAKIPSDDPLAKRLETMRDNIGRVPARQRHFIHFARGKVYEDNKRYEDAMAQFIAGCRIKRQLFQYDEAAALGLFERIRRTFTPELIQAKSGGGSESAQPFFVLGMPRSGTTLVEQIIASHPLVQAAGELGELGKVVQSVKGPDGKQLPYPEFVPALHDQALKQVGDSYAKALDAYAPGARHITDKMPSNYYYVGLIHLALPRARMIHTMRNAADTCISCFSKLFTGDLVYTYDFGELARYWIQYHETMNHWRRVLPPGSFLDVRYEEVVADMEGQARRIIDFVGLPWDDACLRFHELDRPVKTASAMQVRQPIYSGSVDRWKRYGELVKPLIDALGDYARI